MAGAAEGADLAVVEQMLYTNMLFVSMEIDVNLHILKSVIGPMFKFFRSVYFCNRKECVLDIVPKHSDTLDQIKSFAGVNLYRDSSKSEFLQQTNYLALNSLLIMLLH